jgi:hypothetical protein
MRPVHTYSIVARDPNIGELGAAVQSHWFSVGSGVIWAQPGIGAVATQSFTDPSYGPLGLELMHVGKDASQALTALLAADGRVDESLPLFKKAFDEWPLWRELVQRLPAAGLLPDDPALMEKIISVD